MTEWVLLRLILLGLWAYLHGVGWLCVICSRLESAIYRYRCPRPIIDDTSVKACIAAGHCGCDNLDRRP